MANVDAAVASSDEQRLAELGYKQELSRTWSGFQNFAISFTIISILAGCFTTYGQALEQRRAGRDLLGLAADLDPDPDHRLLHVRAGLGLPDRGRHLLVGVQARRPGVGLVHRLVQPHRPDRGDGLGRLRLRDVHEHGLRPLRLRPVQRRRRRNFLHGTFVAVHPGARAARGHQHRRQPPRRAVQLDLGLVARRRRRGDRGGPDRRSRPARQRRLRLHRAPQQLGLQRRHVLVLRPAARLPADAVHDHRLRLVRAHLRGDPRAPPTRPPRACGARSSTRR